MNRTTRQYDPTSRDVRFDASRGSWRRGSPAAELVTATLATEKGSAARDPSWGIDLARAQNARPNAAAELRASIESALSRYTATGALRDLVVTVTAGKLPTGDSALDVRVVCKGRDGEPVDTTVQYPLERR